MGAGILLAAGVWAGVHYLSRDAKLGRRRRRNNGRVESKVKRPMVRLSVRTRARKKK
jgi:hypothetical protein